MAIANISWRFGEAVRIRRIAACLSQEKLAEQADLHPTCVSMIERAPRNPTLDVSAVIAAALSVSLPKLVSEAQQRPIRVGNKPRTGGVRPKHDRTLEHLASFR